ncbi:hypothetical protein NE237_030114 [Protea cynaroides]|uniref:Uncharacterized protein n=1 Tax=Protea cynaroides TaxID=273540 RepID=A0A9Q0JVR7_9MAGN|nr:hypothetical protein NE237_030114 [Protea cynaroides]
MSSSLFGSSPPSTFGTSLYGSLSTASSAVISSDPSTGDVAFGTSILGSSTSATLADMAPIQTALYLLSARKANLLQSELFITDLVRLQDWPPPMVTCHCLSFWSHLMPAWPPPFDALKIRSGLPCISQLFQRPVNISKFAFLAKHERKKEVSRREDISWQILDSLIRTSALGNLIPTLLRLWIPPWPPPYKVFQ